MPVGEGLDVEIFLVHGWWLSIASILIYGFFALPRWCSRWWILVPLTFMGLTASAWAMAAYAIVEGVR